MRKLGVYNMVSLDGYFVDAKGDMSWAHKQDPEWTEYVANNARGGGADFLFGRVTYEMMAKWWPTPQAEQAMPIVAKTMNETTKYIASRTLDKATWQNTTLLQGDLVAAVKQLVETPGNNLLLMGSGSVIAQLAKAGLIDTFQIVVNAIVLGAGRSMFEGVDRQALKLVDVSKPFQNGNVVLKYERA